MEIGRESKGRKEQKQGRKEQGKWEGKGERKESSLGFSTHFKAVQFNIVTDSFAVCSLNHFNSKKEIRTTLCIYLNSILTFKELHILLRYFKVIM